MRKWKRIETIDGPRFRSALAAHEAGLLVSLVTSMLGMYDERESSGPTDELEALTGMKTGNPQPPEDATMKRLLPDFYRPQTEHPAGSGTAESLNSALRGLHEPAIIDAKREAAQRVLDTVPDGGGKFELGADDAQAWANAVNDVRLALGTMLEIGPEGPDRLPPEHPMAGHIDVYQWLTVLQEYLVLGLMGK
ncbi:oxidative stress transcriptional regulator AosR [Mycobacterium sp. NPDC003449]